jgi:putative tryptophan/tyrosine transport system substrate-binding protein
MIRRRLLSMLGGSAVSLSVAASPRQAPAQEKRRRISIIHSGFPDRTPIHLLFEALQARGYANGASATIDLLGAEGDPERLKSLVAQLATQKPELIIALTSPAADELKRVGIATPVVFAFVPDPVAMGLVASLSHPGGNFTGITFSEAALGGKRLEILVDALPETKRVAVVWRRGLTENTAILASIGKSAKLRSIEIQVREVGGMEDLPTAFEGAGQAGAQALVFLADNLMFGHRKEIAALELAHHLPAIHSFALEVADGSLNVVRPESRGELPACGSHRRSHPAG